MTCDRSPFIVTYVLTNVEQCEFPNTATTVEETGSSVTLTGLRAGSSYTVSVESQGFRSAAVAFDTVDEGTCVF